MASTVKYILRNLITLREFCPSLSDHLFLIFGCQRSGTTLLLSILNAHAQINTVDETEFPSPYPFPSAQRLVYNKIFNYYSCFKILEHSHQVEFLQKYYPKAKIIWPIRNPFSTILSMQNLTNSQGNWIQRCGQKEIERLANYYPNKLKDLDFSQLSDTEIGAFYWLYKNKFPQILKDYGFKVYIFKYENLLKNTETQLREIINFLELNWDNKIMNFAQNNPSKTLAGGTKTDQPIDPKRINDFQGLNQDKINIINSICQELITQYNYNLETILENE